MLAITPPGVIQQPGSRLVYGFPARTFVANAHSAKGMLFESRAHKKAALAILIMANTVYSATVDFGVGHGNLVIYGSIVLFFPTFAWCKCLDYLRFYTGFRKG